MKITKNCSSSRTEKDEVAPEAMPQISDCYVHICGIFAIVTVLRGTH